MTSPRGASEPVPLSTELRRTSSPPDSFEFVHIIGSEMCTAEDVFLRGRLLPYKPPPPSPSSTLSPTPPPRTPSHRREHRGSSSDYGGHRRAESLDGFERGSGAASRYWKTKGSHSADYQRLRPVVEAADCARARAAVPPPRPKWYMIMFGSVRVPAEMDMKNVRSRLRRRSSAVGDGSRTDSLGGGRCEVKAAAAGSGGRGAWKLLRSLSCKGDVVGVVDAPLSVGFT